MHCWDVNIAHPSPWTDKDFCFLPRKLAQMISSGDKYMLLYHLFTNNNGCIENTLVRWTWGQNTWPEEMANWTYMHCSNFCDHKLSLKKGDKSKDALSLFSTPFGAHQPNTSGSCGGLLATSKLPGHWLHSGPFLHVSSSPFPILKTSPDWLKAMFALDDLRKTDVHCKQFVGYVLKQYIKRSFHKWNHLSLDHKPKHHASLLSSASVQSS